MNGNNHISKTEQTLNSLNGLQRAAAPPFLYTRIQATLEGGAEQPFTWRDRLAALLARPVVAIACIASIAVVNLAVIFSRGGSTESSSATELVADAYNADVAIADDTYNYAEQ